MLLTFIRACSWWCHWLWVKSVASVSTDRIAHSSQPSLHRWTVCNMNCMLSICR